MFALNFQAAHHEPLLRSRTKNCTVRLGDLRDIYPESSIVWITFGPKLQAKRKMYQAFIDKVRVKEISQLTADDLVHQNPNIHSVSDLIDFFEQHYKRSISPNDIVSVIFFSEILPE
ncbi:RNA-binding protein [Azotosporobacter soli]|uniref:ASCH domain-containing protein n=1 Tax=Azotosporobacter soli TaxID=3055040 RepID=UPI0031FE5A13